MKKKIIFRADGDSKTGLGHLYRLFSLVEIIKNHIDFVYLTQEVSTYSVIPEHYRKAFLPKGITIDREPEWIAKNFLPAEFLIIADGYQFTSAYQKQIKEKGFSLIYIDDLAKEHMFADGVINHSPFVNTKHYKKESFTKLALGTQYALLRPLFLDEAKDDKTISIIDTAFVCFGGADPYDLTLKAVKALLKTKRFKTINIVLGGAYKHEDIFDLRDTNPDKVEIFKNLSESNLLKVMKASNFAIAPASTILYELCCVKMPILSGFYVDNQELIYKGFKKDEAIFTAGDMREFQTEDFYQRIISILEHNGFNECIEAQKKMFDADIAKRHLNLIQSLC